MRGDTVDTMLLEAGVGADEIGMVWIDVEGLERDVLAGMAEVRRARVPVMFEYTAALHQAGDWEALRDMLCQTYTTCVEVRVEGKLAHRAFQDLAQFPMPTGQADLLVFQEQRAP